MRNIDPVNVAVIVLIIVLIVWFLVKVFGGSLGFEEIVIALLVANLGYSFYLNSILSEHLGWHRGQDTKE